MRDALFPSSLPNQDIDIAGSAVKAPPSLLQLRTVVPENDAAWYRCPCGTVMLFFSLGLCTKIAPAVYDSIIHM